jgi:hypothetical protein
VRAIGVTGHVNVNEDVARWVTEALTERLSHPDSPGRPGNPALHGVTCLAEGADQIFARVVLTLRGTFDVVLPARDYAQRMEQTANAATFRELLSQARHVRTMPFATSSRRAYLAASQAMLRRCNLLFAVWDGQPSRHVGDTADVVAKARAQQVEVVVLWPEGACRGPPPAATPPGSTADGYPARRASAAGPGEP